MTCSSSGALRAALARVTPVLGAIPALVPLSDHCKSHTVASVFSLDGGYYLYLWETGEMGCFFPSEMQFSSSSAAPGEL